MNTWLKAAILMTSHTHAHTPTHFGLLCREELPQEQHEQLRLQIFQALLKFATGARVVRTRLCLAVSDSTMPHDVTCLEVTCNDFVRFVCVVYHSSSLTSAPPLPLPSSLACCVCAAYDPTRMAQQHWQHHTHYSLLPPAGEWPSVQYTQ